MSTLSTIWIKAETLKTLLSTVEQKSEKGVSLTVSQGDKMDNYGQNVSAWVSQTKEQKEAKKERYFVANGKVVWSEGVTPVAPKQQPSTPSNTPAPAAKPEEDLPF